jgi:hypothetical protein
MLMLSYFGEDTLTQEMNETRAEFLSRNYVKWFYGPMHGIDKLADVLVWSQVAIRAADAVGLVGKIPGGKVVTMVADIFKLCAPIFQKFALEAKAISKSQLDKLDHAAVRTSLKDHHRTFLVASRELQRTFGSLPCKSRPSISLESPPQT